MSWWNKIFNREIAPAQREAGFSNSDFAERIQHSSTALSTAAARQSDAVHETMASITQIRSMLTQTDSQVTKSMALVENTRHGSVERLKTVDRLQKAMDAIKDSNQLLNDLQDAFQLIHTKTRVINDIVSKTKLLSFNASIEAARAGQFGKGFSIVAEEVGRLAQSSGQAAKEIEHLVMESQLRATSVVEMVIARANDAVNVTREVKQSFSDFSSAISEISSSLGQISHASREQTVGIERTTTAIEKISHATTMSRKSAEEILRLAKSQSESVATPLPPDSQQGLDELVERLNSEHSHSTEVTHSTPMGQVDADDPSFKAQE